MGKSTPKFRKMMWDRNATHGLSQVQAREYRSWKDMRARCRNPNNSDYHNYGGRGIKVCERWDNFAYFFKDMGPRPDGYSIDRKDVNGDYEPGNCRWADQATQANNKRTNHLISFMGETKSLQAWCNQFGLDPSKVRYRISRGFSLDKAFSLEDFRL